MSKKINEFLAGELKELEAKKLYKHERIIESAQGAEITVNGRTVLNFCANNYLGLSSHPRILEAAHKGIDSRGYGLSSVRFICGTQDTHKTLERKTADFLGTDDAILFAACFDANGAIFEPLFGPEDAIITDELNHASIIDGIRLSKAKRYIYRHSDMSDDIQTNERGKETFGLEAALKRANEQGARFKVIATDGVFSMDGDIAKLPEICDLADKYDALVMIDECHASGFMGKRGRGTHEHHGVMDRIDLITTTYGKALGGASGGCIAGSREVIAWMRNKARPYLFSNTLPPAVVSASIECLDMLSETTELRDRLEENTKTFRQGMEKLGFDILPGVHPITPVMFRSYDDPSAKAVEFADRLLQEGIYAIAFSYPVVPLGKDRIRIQLSAAHTPEHIDTALRAFEKVGKDMELI